MVFLSFQFQIVVVLFILLYSAQRVRWIVRSIQQDYCRSSCWKLDLITWSVAEVAEHDLRISPISRRIVLDRA